MPAASRFSLSISADAGRAYVPFVRRHLRAAHRLLRPALHELSVALVGDTQMSSLHERFMDIPGPTDVLTFPLDVDARGRPVAGEVVVCVPEARRRAKEHNVPVERELLLYALHGLLHLCGYDDRTGDDFRAMHRAEDQILTRLGVGPVFAPPDGSVPRRTASPRTRTSRRKRQAASGGGAH
jgi:rRNA maturation RNase YbeY